MPHLPRGSSFLSTLPARGATSAAQLAWAIWLYFYPRSPRGERRQPTTMVQRRKRDFYPRSPRGERPASRMSTSDVDTFLSTLPARGATRSRRMKAPPAGFLSTLPARGATRCAQNMQGCLFPFLSTLPARGATGAAQPGTAELLFVSIHAPREGSDRGQRRAWPLADSFYPRSPRGERRLQLNCRFRYCCFYPRSPRGERPKSAHADAVSIRISIHAPREGSDRRRPGG